MPMAKWLLFGPIAVNKVVRISGAEPSRDCCEPAPPLATAQRGSSPLNGIVQAVGRPLLSGGLPTVLARPSLPTLVLQPPWVPLSSTDAKPVLLLNSCLTQRKLSVTSVPPVGAQATAEKPPGSAPLGALKGDPPPPLCDP